MHKTIENRMAREVVPDLFTAAEARRLLDDGGIVLPWAGRAAERAALVIAAMGVYQLVGVPGLLFVNRSSRAHVVAAAAGPLGLPRDRVLEPAECEALDGRRNPQSLIIPAPEGGGNA
jgi:hypothetical protein